MGGLTDFVRKGVKLIVTESEAGAAAVAPEEEAPGSREIPAEALAVPEPTPVVESRLPSDVQDFAEVYAEAGIALPSHGYGIDKVAEMLANPRLADLGPEIKASAVLAALEAAGVSLAEVIQDAVRRDQALDAFEASKRQARDRLESENRSRLAEIEAEIQSYLREKNGEIEALKAQTQATEEAFVRLADRKRVEEERLRDLVCHFVAPADNPITAPSSPGQTPETEAGPEQP